MPQGKPAGVPCINLDDKLRCTAYEERPAVCRNFVADQMVCGQDHATALKLIGELERITR